jgi:tetratricopeptide (TPR) repeat protein
MKSLPLLERVSKVALYAAVFLVPLWVLPLTQDILAFQKQSLLVVLVFLSVLSWLAKTVSQGELNFRMSWLHVPVLAMVLVVGISTLTSLWSYGSFWGLPLDVTDSFLTVLAFALLYFAMGNILKDSSQLFLVFLLFSFSGVLAGLIAIAHLYGLSFPFAFSQGGGFNTIGSSNSVAIFSAVLLPLSLVLAFVSRMGLRTVLWVVTALHFIILALINFSTAWIVLLAGLLVLLAFGMWNMKKRTEFGWLSFPMALIIVALFFLIFRVAVPGAPQTPLEVAPSMQSEFQIAQQVLKERPLVGSGPGTFIYNYTQYHTPALNQTVFWGTRFVSGASEVLDWAVTKGILGVLSWLALVFMVLYLSVKRLLKPAGDMFKGQKEDSGNFAWMLGLGSLATLVGLLVAQVLYPANFTLWFAFWVVLGAVGLYVAGGLKKVSLAPPSFLALGSSFVFLLVLIFGLGLLFVGGQKYAAEMQYAKGVQASQEGNLETALARVIRAARLNPSSDLYWRDLSQLYLSQVNRLPQNQELTQEQRQQQTQALVSNAVAAARQATTLSPANIANWNVQAFVYRNLIGIQGAGDVAITSYERAIALDPSSPFSWGELARVYILQAQRITDQKGSEEEKALLYEKALENLNKAIELKPDYAPAHYLVAVVYEQQGESGQAIAKLQETKLVAPSDLGVAFQLGVLLFRQDNFTQARTEFERILSANPNHANARYMVGLVYDGQGEKAKAIEQFTLLAASNPDNTELERILRNLEQGNPALQGINAQEPPLQETPPEIVDPIEE